VWNGIKFLGRNRKQIGFEKQIASELMDAWVRGIYFKKEDFREKVTFGT
jgi:hypothetical protein